jgi:hypothetical protein
MLKAKNSKASRAAKRMIQHVLKQRKKKKTAERKALSAVGLR